MSDCTMRWTDERLRALGALLDAASDTTAPSPLVAVVADLVRTLPRHVVEVATDSTGSDVPLLRRAFVNGVIAAP